MSCGIFVQFLKCEILMSDKFVSLAEGGGSSDGLGITERTTVFEYLRNWLTFVLLNPLCFQWKKNLYPVKF
jgi:hypothetical protein